MLVVRSIESPLHLQEGSLLSVNEEGEAETGRPFLYGYTNIQSLKDTGNAFKIKYCWSNHQQCSLPSSTVEHCGRSGCVHLSPFARRLLITRLIENFMSPVL